MFWTSLEPGMPSPTRWIDQNVLELKSRAPTCARKLTRKRQEGTKWRGQAETGGGVSRKLWTPPRRELAATTLQMHSPVDSNSIRLPVFPPLLSPVAQ